MQIGTVSPGVIVTFAGMLTCTFVSGLLLYVMIGEVNRRLPDNKQIPYLFMYPGKVSRIKAEFRRYYPDSRLNFVRGACNALTVVFALALLWQLGFFR